MAEQQGLFTPLGTTKFSIRELVAPKVYDSGIAEGIQSTIKSVANVVNTVKVSNEEARKNALDQYKNQLTIEKAKEISKDTQLGIDYNTARNEDSYINGSFSQQAEVEKSYADKFTQSMGAVTAPTIPTEYANDEEFIALRQSTLASMQGAYENKYQYVAGQLNNIKERELKVSTMITATTDIQNQLADSTKVPTVKFKDLASKLGVGEARNIFETAINSYVSTNLYDISGNTALTPKEAKEKLATVKNNITNYLAKTNTEGTFDGMYKDVFSKIDRLVEEKSTYHINSSYQDTLTPIIEATDPKQVEKLVKTFKSKMETDIGTDSKSKAMWEDNYNNLFSRLDTLKDRALRVAEIEALKGYNKKVASNPNVDFDSLNSDQKKEYKNNFAPKVSDFLLNPSTDKLNFVVNYVEATGSGRVEMRQALKLIANEVNKDPSKKQVLTNAILAIKGNSVLMKEFSKDSIDKELITNVDNADDFIKIVGSPDYLKELKNKNLTKKIVFDEVVSVVKANNKNPYANETLLSHLKINSPSIDLEDTLSKLEANSFEYKKNSNITNLTGYRSGDEAILAGFVKKNLSQYDSLSLNYIFTDKAVIVSTKQGTHIKSWNYTYGNKTVPYNEFMIKERIK